MSVFLRRRPGWEFPLAARGEGALIWDDQGRRLIDAAGGAVVVNVGHGVREIADAIAEQARRLAYVHATELTTEPVERLAAELGRRAPVDDARLFLVAGGSEASETAIKLARQYQVARGERGRFKVIARRPSFHGSSLGALALSALRGLGDLPAVGDVRGIGLMAAVEIVRDRATREPYPRKARMGQAIQAEALRRGAIVYASGGQADGRGDLVMLGPPLTIERDQVDEAVAALGAAVAAVTRDR